MLASLEDARGEEEAEAGIDLMLGGSERQRPWPSVADLLRMDEDQRVAWERLIAEALC
ncbi:hypothetical protein [Methylobacterium oxalidis]|uniref:Uncharacterized protein n=1 Tax=Methylobacterium oxalidis TaxID=944322 RepID=A0A512J7E4_9HYPH|nr:hypothetical protein [Methylobacterium oxalidis]GEP05822.1 hypothetical protein MOX02_38600 [Methylobacterium oxalidis]GJE34408.1 hypothetical protein LDDCCGHA_4619 [Methylobacterium oxalidis]GLS66473.1 hypothetical protein GCM10007888_48560 [Methylobacterium oxalidis]